jgi:dTMP kinase
VLTREPGGTPYAEKIRQLLLMDQDGEGSSAHTQLALFWAARSDHIHRLIRPRLEAGETVVTDRFDLSTYAYQLCGKQAPKELEKLFWKMREVYVTSQLPANSIHYIYLDIPPEIGLERIAARNGEVTHFDRESLEFHQRVYQGGHAFMKKIVRQTPKGKEPNAWLVDATEEENEVHLQIVRDIQEIQTQ